ncbi:hypothetical protein [Saccharothrix sp. ST-888]|uniref:hypothetical protein n=1 Tax=Saccharothrix sp. ST-888 TaxID=1427391 RepID=UPI0005EC9B0A|nr:hypothetical protein [Saccharothrix sp. ST-888]KJK59269.1 hypothetical protein UK12_05440 [Saccharothrix sp. ST-888]
MTGGGAVPEGRAVSWAAGFREGCVGDLGAVDVLHRLALAVSPVDARTNGPVWPGVRADREIESPPDRFGRSLLRVLPLEAHGGTAFVLRYGSSCGVGVRGRTVSLRIADPASRWVPRRFVLPLWTRAELAEAERPSGTFVPVAARLLRPWLLPGVAYPVAGGVTGLRLRVTSEGVPVRWPRVEAFGPGGLRVGWAHGDQYGQVLLLVDGTGALPPPTPARFDVALRAHIPDPATAPPPEALDRLDALDPLDPLGDLVVEAVGRSHNPPRPEDLDNDVLRGLAVPDGYLTAAGDVVRSLTVGQVIRSPDLPFG